MAVARAPFIFLLVNKSVMSIGHRFRRNPSNGKKTDPLCPSGLKEMLSVSMWDSHRNKQVHNNERISRD